jgi:hypothetical protein
MQRSEALTYYQKENTDSTKQEKIEKEAQKTMLRIWVSVRVFSLKTPDGVSAATQHPKILIGDEQLRRFSYICGIRLKIKVITMSRSYYFNGTFSMKKILF